MKNKIMVHAGLFHADDVLCVTMARILNENIAVERVYKVPETVDEDTIIADIGCGKYDHHQADTPLRRDGFPHCAASLMWEDEFGKEVVSLLHPTLNEEQVLSVVAGVDTMLLRSVAAIDNGCKTTKSQAGSQTLGSSDVYSLNSMVSMFNPCWNSDVNPNDAFMEAVDFATMILKRMIARLAASVEGEKIIADAVEKSTQSNTPEIVVLPQFVPWQSFVCRNAAQALVMVYPAIRGGWNIQMVPVAVNSRDTRAVMPRSWYGLSDLSADKAMHGMTFCHKSGFMAAFKTKNDALAAAYTVVGKTA